MAYYDPYPTITKNRFLNFITGGRRIGKTYSFKKALIKNVLKTDSKIAYVRRRQIELDNIMDFMDALRDDPDFSSYEIVEKKVNAVKTVQFNGKIVVAMYALSNSRNLRSSGDFKGFKYLMFDEFLPEDGSYIKDEPERFLNLIETIQRDNKQFQVFAIANAKQLNNPYFEYFNTYPSNREYTFFNDKSVLIQIVNMVAPSKDPNTPFERLIKGTAYGDMSTNNTFADDNDEFVEPVPENAKELATLVLDNKNYGLWVYEGLWYISKKTSNTKRFSMDGEDLTLNYFFKSDLSKSLMMARNHGKLRFDNGNTRETMRRLLI